MNKLNLQKRARNFAALMSVGTGLAIGALSPSASAAGAGGIPVQVEYIGSSSQLYVQFGGVNYIGQTASPGCSLPAMSADAVKIWASQAQAALLAGKNVTIYYNTCNSNSYIYDVVLRS